MPYFISNLAAATLLALNVGAPPSAPLVVEGLAADVREPVYVPIEFASVVEADTVAPSDDVRPTAWMSRVRRCSQRGGRRFCDGPRMVPVASPEAAARREALGLGTGMVVARVMRGRPDPAWVDAVESKTHATMRFPVDAGWVGRGVGYVRRSELRHRRHEGIDVSAAPGTPVRSVEDGLVLYADNGLRGYGNLVVVVHPDGTSSLYAHLREAWVAAGERVAQGQVIGQVGTTGLSFGPHLHFEWRARGRARDPLPRFDQVPLRPADDEARRRLVAAR
jgi:murein DD-endopeptidase MepM/ murein hydrolase activator NlpD